MTVYSETLWNTYYTKHGLTQIPLLALEMALHDIDSLITHVHISSVIFFKRFTNLARYFQHANTRSICSRKMQRHAHLGQFKNSEEKEDKPCEADAFCPPQLYHLKCSYTSNHHKLEDPHVDYKKMYQKKKHLVAPQAN